MALNTHCTVRSQPDRCLLQNATPKFNDTTLRQTIKLDLPATNGNVSTRHVRFRFSNAFGTSPLDISAATVARPLNNRAGVSVVEEDSTLALTFNAGANGISVPAGALAVSDPVEFDFAGIESYVGNGTLQSGSIVTISMYLQNGQQGEAITSHPGSRTTSYLVNGNQVQANNLTGQVQSQAHWYFISAVESLESSAEASAFLVVGDSITDGRGTVTDANNRWPDFLFSRMQRSNSSVARRVTVNNQAAGGNCVLSACLGPSVVSRIDRDVLAQSGVRYAMLFEGVNDIGGAAADVATQNLVVDNLIAGYQQIITRIRAQGIPMFGATITPFSGNSTIQPYGDAAGIREQSRVKVNDWIRNSGAFDAVIDFDAAVRDPEEVTMLKTEYDSGDFLHLNVAGYQAMAESFPLGLFQQFADGVDED